MYDENIIEFLHLSTWRIEDLSQDSFEAFVDSGIREPQVKKLFNDIRSRLN